MATIEYLRPLSELALPDPRHKGRDELLLSIHGALTEIRLNDSVPEHVVQLFETAKHLSLYSWFVFRFHPVARLVGYTCLEAALRPLALNDSAFPSGKHRNGKPSLKDLLEHAVDRGWLRNEGFDTARHLAGVRARHKAVIDQIKEMSALGLEEMEVREPTSEEIAAELAVLSYARDLSKSIPAVRNHIAHGNSFLDNGSVAVLKIVADAVNQLYSRSK